MKKIKINREYTKVENGKFYFVDDVMGAAAKLLTGTGFKLYIYMLTSTLDHFTFTTEDCIKKTGLSPRSIYNAFKDLELNGYLSYDEQEKEYIMEELPSECA